MSFEEARKKKEKRSFEYACRQGYCPSLEERENSEIKELANRLKAASDTETLTNVLEWQDRNFAFWFERNPLLLAISSAVVVFLITSPFLILNSPIVYGFFAILASVIVTLCLTAVYMIHSYRKLPVKQLFNIFSLNVPIDTILANRLCLCRDYAKLTACLLFNVYPEREVYFAHATNHVAAAAMVGEKLYVLDKHLPVTTIDKWHERWHQGEYSEKTLQKVTGTVLEPVDLKSHLSKPSPKNLDAGRLTNEMQSRLGIQDPADAPQEATLNVLRWKKGALLYEDDELVNYSLARQLKTKISAQMLDLSQLTRVKVTREADDLIFQVSFKLK
jgi:predicted transglutaminase-like protease